MKHNRTAEAAALLQEIVDWCARTGTPVNHIGHVLFLHPGFVALMRLRLTVSEEKEREIRQFMADHPGGWRGELPKTHANGTKPRQPWVSSFRAERGPVERESALKMSEEEIAARRVDNGCCPRCGARLAVGCRHARAA